VKNKSVLSNACLLISFRGCARFRIAVCGYFISWRKVKRVSLYFRFVWSDPDWSAEVSPNVRHLHFINHRLPCQILVRDILSVIISNIYSPSENNLDYNWEKTEKCIGYSAINHNRRLNKLLFCKAILKCIWIYGIQLWALGFQYRNITKIAKQIPRDYHQSSTNHTLHRDLNVRGEINADKDICW